VPAGFSEKRAIRATVTDAAAEAKAGTEVTEDAVLGGRVRLRQPRAGYRVAIDPVLLAAAVPASAGDVALDVGAGAGAAALCLAKRVANCRVFGIEKERELVRLAAENVVINKLEGSVDVMLGDLARPPPRLAAGTFDHVLANPPHLEAGRADPSPHTGRATATVEGAGGLGEWVGFCVRMARQRGSVTFIHRADRLDELLAHLRAQAGAIVVFPLWPDAARLETAKRVIVRAIKGAQTPLRLASGLALHAEDGSYTERAEAVLRGGRALEI
jgi:tRNA1(Val) A37 N6-methylase TrmN6